MKTSDIISILVSAAILTLLMSIPWWPITAWNYQENVTNVLVGSLFINAVRWLYQQWVQKG